LPLGTWRKRWPSAVQSRTAGLNKEISDYEKSPKFREKINEVIVGPAVHHYAIDVYLKDEVLRPGWSVLELGCAAGAMLQMVKRTYKGGIGE